LKIIGGGLGYMATGGSGAIMAGPFSPADTAGGHLVPADKKLDPTWVKGLFERGTKDVFRGKSLDTIGMPCGGIAAGQLYLCGDGTLGCWMIFNDEISNWVEGTSATYQHKGIAKPLVQGFAVALWRGGEILQKPLSKEGFSEVEFQGEYPIGKVRYSDPTLPLRIELEAFSPFIPTQARDSALPATLLNYTIENTGSEEIDIRLTGWLENAVCAKAGAETVNRRFTRFDRDDSRLVMVHGARPSEEGEESDPRTRVFADFEGEDWGNWTVEGEGFGPGPVAGTLPGQQKVEGFEGEKLVNTFVGGDDMKGRLLSPAFKIERQFINLKVGGGNRSSSSAEGDTSIRLMIGEDTIHSARGKNIELLEWHSWYVGDRLGQEARIAIVDSAAGGWGHLNVDQIEFSDSPRADLPAALLLAADYGTLALACAQPAGEGETLEELPQTFAQGLPVLNSDSSYPLKEKQLGVVASERTTLAPGEKMTVSFVLAWHFPNAKNGRQYAVRFADAAQVANYLLDRQEILTQPTRMWRDTFYDSTLPYWLLDRLHSTVSILATGTCQWWESGRFWAYEGVTCCHGTCTHVWNYAHAHARLFPELARTIREMQDFNPVENGGAFYESGLVAFRGDDSQSFTYAADGQCGTVLKAYREHLCSPDNSFLERHWPRIKSALEFSIRKDGDNNGLIECEQHNTFDINYYGPNTFVGALYLAALRAGEEMARVMGDLPFARHVRAIYEKGRDLTLERLWDGEYFFQVVDLKKHPAHQYAHGCLSDQVFGANWARMVGLGHLYPADETRTALESIWKYNWAPDIGPYNQVHKPFRWFISAGQAGLFTCTWPKSEYLDQGTLYREEVWTGTEYQVASHMIWEGMVTEGLAICRAVHDRYHPDNFNPYNEIECGDHYARAMASWGVFLAVCGFEYDGPRGHIGFSPRLSPENFKAAFVGAEGWGSFEQSQSGSEFKAALVVRHGRLRLASLSLQLPEGRKIEGVRATYQGNSLEVLPELPDSRVLLKLNRDILLEAGEAFEAVLDLAL
jgi:uncharacterized protein (DUF608 family)